MMAQNCEFLGQLESWNDLGKHMYITEVSVKKRAYNLETSAVVDFVNKPLAKIQFTYHLNFKCSKNVWWMFL